MSASVSSQGESSQYGNHSINLPSNSSDDFEQRYQAQDFL